MIALRDAFRALRATRIITAVAILSLALGIGANTAMFSIVDALVLRELPVPHADRLTLLSATVESKTSAESWITTWWTNPIWEAIRDRPTLFDDAFAFSNTRFDIARSGEVEPVDALRASGRMFDVLGVRPIMGRVFNEADDRRGGGPDGPVAVISSGFWRRRFGGARDVVGRNIILNRVPFTIIGVTPPSFFGPEVGRTFDVSVPLGTVPLVSGNRRLLDSRSNWWLQVMVRVKPGQTAGQATALLRAAQRQIADETRPTDWRSQDAAAYLSSPFILQPAATGSSEIRRSYQRPVLILMAIVGLTLLIACGNIANLLLARTTARRHEMSIRRALGASPWQLARQLLAESLLLSAAGAVLGVLLAAWGSRLIVSQISTATNRVFLGTDLDGRMLAFTAAVGVATALLFGVTPARRAARVSPIEAMREQSRGSSSRRSLGLAGGLVMAQVAVSLVLLTGAGLFVRTFTSLASRNLGFERDRALVVRIGAERAGVDSAPRRALYDRIRQAALGVPLVSRAALSVTMPVGDNQLIRRMDFPDRPELSERERLVLRNFVTPGWFATIGMPLTGGRDFDDRDRVGAPRTVIVNRAFVRKYFNGKDPIGRIVMESPEPGSDPRPLEIVGVVGDAVYRSLHDDPPPTTYWPLDQVTQPPPSITLTVRAATGAPAALTRAISSALRDVNGNLSLAFRPLADQLNASITQERLIATVSGFFGALALLLAALGLYGITAYAVTQRHVELGIRMALGATPAGVIRLVLARVALLVGGGVVIGVAVSWWSSMFIASLVFGVAPRDATTTTVAIAVLATVGALAGLLPAMRAARIDPARVLRQG